MLNRYLNNTAAIQELVKGALEATIRLHTNKSTTVYYEIDDQIVNEPGRIRLILNSPHS